MSIAEARPVTMRDLFGVRAFAVLFPAGVISDVGTVLARLALTVLVFERTGSAAAAALTYATSFLPSIVGGVWLGGLGDRYPHRAVMVSADLARAGLFLGMAAPGVPLAVVVSLLVLAVALGPAFTSAEVSYLAAALSDEQFRASSGVRSSADQFTQVLGFGVGGAVIAAVSPSGALVIDAVTFVVSAAATLTLLPSQRAAVSADASAESRPSGGDVAFDGLWRDRRTRVPMAFTLVVGLFVAPEALAVSYGERISATAGQVGVLLAMIPLGSALGAAAIIRVPPALRSRSTAVLAVAAGVPLLACAADPGWAVSCLCWFLAGLLTAYQVDVIADLVTAIPSQVRGASLGVVGAWLAGAQGAAFAACGVLAGAVGPGPAIAATAGLGIVLALGVVWTRRRLGATPLADAPAT